MELPRDKGLHKDSIVAIVMVVPHGSKFIHSKATTLFSYTVLDEQRRPRGIYDNRECNQHEEYKHYRQDYDTDDQVENPFTVFVRLGTWFRNLLILTRLLHIGKGHLLIPP